MITKNKHEQLYTNRHHKYRPTARVVALSGIRTAQTRRPCKPSPSLCIRKHIPKCHGSATCASASSSSSPSPVATLAHTRRTAIRQRGDYDQLRRRRPTTTDNDGGDSPARDVLNVKCVRSSDKSQFVITRVIIACTAYCCVVLLLQSYYALIACTLRVWYSEHALHIITIYNNIYTLAHVVLCIKCRQC